MKASIKTTLIIITIIIVVLVIVTFSTSNLLSARTFSQSNYPAGISIEIPPEIPDQDAGDCQSICQTSCADFTSPSQIQTCLAECTSFCAEDF